EPVRIPLQDYWADQENDLIEFAGRRWTIAHLPPCNRDGTELCQDWAELKAERFWRAIDSRLPSVTLPIEDVVFTHQIIPTPAFLNGVVFPEWPKDRVTKIISAYFNKCLFLGWCSFSHVKFVHSFFEHAR